MMKLTKAILAVAACGLLGVVTTVRAGHDCQSDCPADCGKKVCVPTPDVKVTEKRVYTEKYEDFCMPCSCWDMLFHRCGGCSKVYTRKVLVVKIRKCETPITKCVPAVQESCDSGCPSCCATAHGSCSTCASGGTVVSGPAPTALPAPPMSGPPHNAAPVTIPGGPVIQSQPLLPGSYPANNAGPAIQPQPIPPGAQPGYNAARMPGGH